MPPSEARRRSSSRLAGLRRHRSNPMSLPSAGRVASRAAAGAGLRRPRVRVPRPDALDARAHRRLDGDRVRSDRDGGVGEAARPDVPGRRARALLRPPDARRRRCGRSTSAAAGCTTTSTRCSSSTGRRRRRGRSTRRRPTDPHGVTQRRRYRTDGRRIVDISDESLDGTGVEGASVSDFLLEELERRREGRMRDIVATIQSDQYRLITAEPERRARRAGRPGHRQDRRRAAPRVVAALHAPRAAAPRARRRPEPDVHGLRLARAAGARRGGGRAARGVGAPRRHRGRRARRRRTSRG